MKFPRISPRARRGVISISVVTATAGALVATAIAASAAGSIQKGAGYTVSGGDFVGYYITNGHDGYCIDPSLGLTTGQSWQTIHRLTGLNAVKSQELEYVLYKHGNTKSNSVAASVSQALNTIDGNKSAVARRYKTIPKAVQKTVKARATAYVHEAALYYGPYRTSVVVTKKVLPGQVGTAVVSVVSASKHVVPGVTVDLTASNASVPRAVRTGSRGVAFHFTRGASTAGVSLHARAIGVAPTTMLLGRRPSSRQQRLLSWSPGTTASGSAGYQLSETVKGGYNCATVCDGHPPVNVSLCHSNGEYARQLYVYENGHVVKVVNFSRTSGCASTSFTGTDTQVVSFKCRYQVGSKWTALAICGTSFKIDCPPWPVVSEQMSCSCTTGMILLGLPKNISAHTKAIEFASMESTITYTYTGSSTSHIAKAGSTVVLYEKTGATLNVKIAFDRSKSTTDVIFWGSVQRSNGQWNGDQAHNGQEVIVRQI